MNELQRRLAQLEPEQRRRLQAMLNRQGCTVELRRHSVSHAPLALPQRRLWLLAEMGSDEGAYNIPGVFRIRGALQVQLMAQALQTIATRHEILRTTFETDDNGGVRQRIHPHPLAALELHDGVLADASAQETFARDTVRAPLDLRSGPCWRAVLASCADGSWLLAFSFHHIIFDGRSLGVFIKELFALMQPSTYQVTPAEPALQYSDYVTWQADRYDTATRERELAYWCSQLGGALPVLELPAGRTRSATPSHQGGLVQHLLPPSLHAAIKQFAREQQSTPYAVCLAALAAVLARHAGQDELIIGTPVAGREEASLAQMIGVFVNTLPIRVRVAPQDGFATLVTQVRDTSLAAFSHATLPFEDIVEAVRPERSPGRHPVFQVLYTHQNAVPPVKAGGLEIVYADIDQGSAKFELSLDVVEGTLGPCCLWEYRSDLFERSRIERLARHFEQWLTAALAAPEQPLKTLPMLDAAELAILGAEPARTAAQALPATNLVALIEPHALATPEAVAVRSEDNELNYAELNAGANRMARALLARGARCGRPIAVCLPRGPAQVQAVLAVLKTGCAFVVHLECGRRCQRSGAATGVWHERRGHLGRVGGQRPGGLPRHGAGASGQRGVLSGATRCVWRGRAGRRPCLF